MIPRRAGPAWKPYWYAIGWRSHWFAVYLLVTTCRSSEMAELREPLPATLLALDAKGYSRRPALTHLEVRKGIREITTEGLRRACIDPIAVTHQDTGDGLLAVIPAQVPKAT